MSLILLDCRRRGRPKNQYRHGNVTENNSADDLSVTAAQSDVISEMSLNGLGLKWCAFISEALKLNNGQ